MEFNWDIANSSHIARHGISPAEAEEIFRGVYIDLAFSDTHEEGRFGIIGETQRGRILIVWFTVRGEAIRVVTAWEARKAEKLQYLEARRIEHEI